MDSAADICRIIVTMPFDDRTRVTAMFVNRSTYLPKLLFARLLTLALILHTVPRSFLEPCLCRFGPVTPPFAPSFDLKT